jgi:hypothetical protein
VSIRLGENGFTVKREYIEEDVIRELKYASD